MYCVLFSGDVAIVLVTNITVVRGALLFLIDQATDFFFLID